MPPAARITDMHVCPMVTGVVPHVGGPILPPGMPTVLIGMLPAARMTDMATCVGPPDMIAMGSPTVLIGNLMAARMGDPTIHGGVIVLGEMTVMIGEVGMGTPVIDTPDVGVVVPPMVDAGLPKTGGEMGTGPSTVDLHSKFIQGLSMAPMLVLANAMIRRPLKRWRRRR